MTMACPDEVQPGQLRENFRRRGEGRTDSDVAGSINHRLTNLFRRMRTDANQRAGTKDSPGVLHAHVVLAEVDAVGFDEASDVRPIVHDEERVRLASTGGRCGHAR